MTDEVTLGEHSLPVPDQRIGYLENKARRFFNGLTKLDVDPGDLSSGAFIAKLTREQAYEAMCLMVPKLAKRMPLYEFAGYQSQEAMDAGDYDDEADKSPTFPECVHAYEVFVRVNRFDVFKGAVAMVKDLFGKADPKVIGQVMNLALAEGASKLSPSSPHTNGTSASTSSTTTPPTTTVPVE